MKLRRVYRKRPKWNRVVRGGSWNNNASSLRAANRGYSSASFQYDTLGARLSKRKGGKG
jgi:formylglycine-generating enzyme required for sulfatase activity